MRLNCKPDFNMPGSSACLCCHTFPAINSIFFILSYKIYNSFWLHQPYSHHIRKCAHEIIFYISKHFYWCLHARYTKGKLVVAHICSFTNVNLLFVWWIIYERMGPGFVRKELVWEAFDAFVFRFQVKICVGSNANTTFLNDIDVVSNSDVIRETS